MTLNEHIPEEIYRCVRLSEDVKLIGKKVIFEIEKAGVMVIPIVWFAIKRNFTDGQKY